MKGEITWDVLERAVIDHPEIRVLVLLLTSPVAFMAGCGAAALVG